MSRRRSLDDVFDDVASFAAVHVDAMVADARDVLRGAAASAGNSIIEEIVGKIEAAVGVTLRAANNPSAILLLQFVATVRAARNFGIPEDHILDLFARSIAESKPNPKKAPA